ncbi:MAG: extracellular solute-binding protein, partial [Egibacteraceae bacterium]
MRTTPHLTMRAALLALLMALGALLVACEADEADETDGDDAAAEADDAEADDAEADDAEADDAEADDAEADDAETEESGTITVYSGRSEELVGPILEDYADASGVDVEVRYGDTAEMAATILEEGSNSPADLFFGQDAGALGALKVEGRLQDLPEDTLARVDERFADPDGQWVGTSGRARVLSYNTDALDAEDLPESILDVTDPEWEGRVGWAPTNGSLQAHVTAMRVELG